MTFEFFLDQAWSDHAASANEVGIRLAKGVPLVEEAKQISSLVNLATHVFGDHLGAWNKGIAFLESLRNIPTYCAHGECENALTRSIGVLRLAGGNEEVLKNFALSDQIRVLAQGAGTLSQQGAAERAQKYFRLALEKARTGLRHDDPANRALAITGNNLACTLEEKVMRSSAEDELMILAAETGRKYWEIAGTMREVSIEDVSPRHYFSQSGKNSTRTGARQNLRGNDAGK